MNVCRTLVAILVATAASVAGAATFTVTTPAEFQSALTTAQANGESDSISVAAGIYNLNSTLTYTAVSTENFSLVINGTDSDLVTLNGGSQLPILRIDTTAVEADDGVFVEVRNMTFINGNAIGTPADGGALSIVMDDANQPAVFATIVFVTGSEFFDNTADGNGGAIYIRSPAVEGIYLEDLTFDGNSAGGSGGAAYVEGRWVGTPLSFNNIDFFNNTAQGSGGALYAGGFDVSTPGSDRASSISLNDITFLGNDSLGTEATDGGGGADLGASGPINITLTGFIDNDAQYGAGLRVRPDFATITMVNSGFTGNVATEDGGAVWASDSIFASVTMTNNTIYANTATNRGGGVFLEFGGSISFADVYNNILYANTAQQGDGDDLFVNNNSPQDIPGIVNLFNNIVTDVTVIPGPVNEGDNLDQDPLLVDIDARPDPDPRLGSGSPAIDTGLNTAPTAPAFDFEGDSRPLDGNGDNTATIDIGIDEFTGTASQNADLAIAKTGTPNPVTEGGNITYTVTVTNNGPGDASSVSMVDTLANLLAFGSATPSQGSCTTASNVVTCALGSIANGANATVTIIAATPDVPESTVVTNSATVSGAETDPDATNNSVTVDTTIVPAGPVLADVAVTKADAPDPVISGGPQLSYSIAVTNNGPAGASGVVLTDTLPTGVDFVSANATTGTCAHDTGVVTCNIGALANGAASDVTIAVSPQVVEAATDITNTATVTATEEDPTPGNNTATTTTTVNPPEANLGLDISSSPDEPLINEQITYVVSASNAGPSNDTGVVISIELPPGVTLVSVTPDQGTCKIGEGTITCIIGDLAAGATADVEVVVTAPGEAGTITLSATVDADFADPTPGDNDATDVIVVIDVIDFVIEGRSEGTGSVGWLEVFALLGAAGLATALRYSRRHAAALALVAVLPFAALLTADDAWADNDWYVGAAIGAADVDYKAADLTSDLAGLGWTIDDVTVDNDGTAWKIYGGWSITNYFALELGWVDLGKIETRYSTTIPPNEIDNILTDTFNVHPLTGDGITAAAVLRWPFADNFAVHAKIGLFAWESDVDVRVVEGGTGQVLGDQDGTEGMYGIGLEWTIDDRWSLTAEWERYQLNEWIDTPMFGVRFGF
ncbi:MAG: choice-of-anchor Q domain-containing protein [Woeseiaceae bacterium]|jgi:uncharacterized repeat protein (TIGR01451 family)|nr:choice-of-anchor Q domain-containing protein [Woeseiaceae bacterium]